MLSFDSDCPMDKNQEIPFKIIDQGGEREEIGSNMLK